MFTIKGIECFVTMYNKASGDWTGGEYIKDNPYSDELMVLNKESLTESISSMLDANIEFKHIYTQDNLVTVSIVENGNGDPDENGGFLVDYIFKVSRISNVDIDKVLKEGSN